MQTILPRHRAARHCAARCCSTRRASVILGRMADLWVCDLGLAPVSRGARAAGGCAPRARPTRSRTRCCCSSTRRSTRAGGAPARTSCRRPRAFDAAHAIEIVDVDRGGSVTYHGPGQLVGYPIVRIGDVIGYLRALERAIIAALAREGVAAHGGGERPTGRLGRRAQDRLARRARLAARETHGFAINADNDLEPFAWIVPCGLPGVADDLGRARDRAHRDLARFARPRRRRARARARAPARGPRSRRERLAVAAGAPVG